VATLTSKRLAAVEVRSDTDGSGCCNGYATTLDSCTCYDFRHGGSYAGRCKHIEALARRTPCKRCGGLMRFGWQPSALTTFACACGWTVDAALVIEDRKAVAGAA